MLQRIDLFSCFCCRQGVENIRNEIQDTLEPLIDPVHGHGRCASHTHLLTRQACAVWFYMDVPVGGLKGDAGETLRPCLLVFSQSLVNLLVNGHAVSNVWDGDRECSGMSKTHTHTQIHYIKTFSWQGEHVHHAHERELLEGLHCE